MITIIEKKNVLKKNSIGDWYSIPENMANEFTRLDEEIQNSEFGNNDWLSALDNFNQTFGKYLKY